MKRILKFLIACSLFMFVGCVSLAPKGFVAQLAGWNTIQMRAGITEAKAWNTFVSVISEKYDIEVMEKESGYIRTNWIVEGSTANRIIEPNNTLRIKVESRYYDKLREEWVTGFSNTVTEAVKQDLQGRLQ